MLVLKLFSLVPLLLLLLLLLMNESTDSAQGSYELKIEY